MLIATAGHVDHGKTSLVRALTGVDTDRLPEEKQRGLTIDLGFAYLPLAGGEVLGFVDVPGHERFVRNMIAGVPAIDRALLVVAADDGPMPQTREHLAILDLLGVPGGAIVLSKIDRVDAARVAEVSGQLRDLAAGSVLADAPILALSAHTGEGVAQLRAYLEQAAGALVRGARDGGLRFAIDRSFSVQGAGLVVTGAVYAGEVRVGDHLALAGRALPVRVRGIESAGREVDAASAGMRCALNLAGRAVDARSVRRGDWLLGPEAGPPSERIDVRLRVLASEARAFAQWTPVHVHHGAAFVTAHVTMPAGKAIEPGGEAPAQLVLARPISAVHGERMVLRDASGQRTIAGALVIDPYAPRRAGDRAARLALLDALREANPRSALERALAVAPQGVDPRQFAHARNLAPDAVREMARTLGALGVNTRDGERVVLPRDWQSICDALTAALAAHHEQQSESMGPRESELVHAIAPGPRTALAHAALGELVRSGVLVRDGVSLRLSTHRARLTAADEALWQRVSEHLRSDAVKPLTSGDLAKVLEVELPGLLAFLETCARRGLLIRIAPNRFFHPQALARLAAHAQQLSEQHAQSGFDARAFRDATGIGRNLTIEVLEYFDGVGLTRRRDEVRHAIRSAESLFGTVQVGSWMSVRPRARSKTPG